MASFLQSASITLVMAFKILLLIVFQNKPLVVFRLFCYAISIRLGVLIQLFLYRQGHPFRLYRRE
ncbi:hypothetical protein [Larkinella rosea]|uniref:Uncharacterized protein n=1 Tax=Larkinella rosea TaxID=2025312 RepID=A0A3P1BFD0_9BACT|nr:hypothetical protein [Larkinella rosea]RRA99740.1 hypothetical protein EHT25_24205 [Larkinella rosea]